VLPASVSRATVLRALGFALALGLGAVGVWLIVTGDSQKAVRLGALGSLWGLLLGSFVMFGSRRHHDAAPGTDLMPASSGKLVPASDAAAQREYEQRLVALLRREIQAGMNAEVAALRTELAELRTELLDKVGGQIALERIETTRIIGSDLEALQREVRELRQGATGEEPDADTDGPKSLFGRRAVPRARPAARPAPARAEIVEAEVVEVDDAGYRGRRRRSEDGPDAAATVGRDTPEGEQLLARLLARGAE